jgi:1-acyl-sn-glycerol-3-phosphate acyltransferase
LKLQAGILLTPNHWCNGDGLIVGILAAQANAFCYYLVADHIFRRSPWTGWLINRHGAFSVLREGTDRESLRTSVQVLGSAERPLVIFAEGTWYRQNDRVGPMQEGPALIAQQAARHSDRPIVIHAVAIKYWMLQDPRPALIHRLETIERQFGISAGDSTDIIARLKIANAAWVAAQERSILGAEQVGDVDQRCLQLAERLVSRLETTHLGRRTDQSLMDRVWRLRGINVRNLMDKSGLAATARLHLDLLLLCEFLYSHSLAYLDEHPTFERLAESVQRLEEIVFDRFAQPVVPMGVTVEVGEPIAVTSETPSDTQVGDRRRQLMANVKTKLQGLLDGLNEMGPPASWRKFVDPASKGGFSHV